MHEYLQKAPKTAEEIQAPQIRTLLIPQQRGRQSQKRRKDEEGFGSRVQRHDNPEHVDDGREAHGYLGAETEGERGRDQRADAEREIDGRQRDETDVGVQRGDEILRNQIGNEEKDKAAGEVNDLRLLRTKRFACKCLNQSKNQTLRQKKKDTCSNN